MGNPGLQPFTNSNRNLSVEWYVNKDTMLTAAVFEQKGKIGAGDLLEVEDTAGKRALVPFRPGIADLENGRVVIDPAFLA